MRTLTLLKTVFKKDVVERIRYYFNTISAVLSTYLLFLVVFFGTKSFFGDRLAVDEVVGDVQVVFLVWSLAAFVFIEIAFIFTLEAQEGTLEQLAMSPFGLAQVVLFEAVVALVGNVVVIAALLLLIMLTTGRWLHIDLVSVLPLLLITMTSVFGLGLALGGLALVFKRIQAFFQILQFGFLAVVSAPIDSFPWMKFLPLSWGSHLLRQTMVEGRSILEMPSGDLLFLAVHSLVYLTLGILIFNRVDRKAREHGLLGHY